MDNNKIPLVLIIDDDPTIGLWASRTLTKTGFKVVSALNGYLGVELFKQISPDIVMIDIEMPVMGGLETCEILSALVSETKVPLIMVTGSEDPQKIAHAYRAGASDFIVKPVNEKILVERLRYQLKTADLFQQLLLTKSRLKHAQRLAKVGEWEFNPLSQALFWNTGAYEVFHQSPRSIRLTYNSFLSLINIHDRKSVEDAIAKILDDGMAIEIEYRVMIKNSKQVFINQLIEADTDNDGNVILLSSSVQDVTYRNMHDEEVRQLAYFDELTKLPNRTHFYEHVKKAIELSKRKEREFALLFLDLDDFKSINDTFGHHAGDLLLQDISRRLVGGLRRSDMAAVDMEKYQYHVDISRLGGDEFTILVNEMKNIEDAAYVAQRVLKLIADPMEIDGNTIYNKASIGIAVYPQDGEDVDTLLKNADIAMYDAKSKGKGIYHYFHATMNEEADYKMRLSSCMHDAVKNNELLLHYQPIIDVKTKQLVGAEALLRWDNKELGFLMPDKFIDLAESNSMIIEFGTWVIREVCERLSFWHEQELSPFTVSVNLSGLQFNQPDFIDDVKVIIQETGVDTSLLVFEITESMLMGDNEQSLVILNAVRELGIKLSIDDFGTGFSSLSYLKHFPVSYLKIDRAFIKDTPEDQDDTAIVRAIIALAKSLGLETIAEGVETQEQRDMLEQYECEKIQGYFYSKPLDEALFIKYAKSKY